MTATVRAELSEKAEPESIGHEIDAKESPSEITLNYDEEHNYKVFEIVDIDNKVRDYRPNSRDLNQEHAYELRKQDIFAAAIARDAQLKQEAEEQQRLEVEQQQVNPPVEKFKFVSDSMEQQRIDMEKARLAEEEEKAAIEKAEIAEQERVFMEKVDRIAAEQDILERFEAERAKQEESN